MEIVGIALKNNIFHARKAKNICCVCLNNACV